MTEPVTTNDMPAPLKQGANVMPAKHATAHRVANAKAAMMMANKPGK